MFKSDSLNQHHVRRNIVQQVRDLQANQQQQIVRDVHAENLSDLVDNLDSELLIEKGITGRDQNGNLLYEITGSEANTPANNLNINWWLPMTLADDDVSIIHDLCFQTISGVKYLYVGGYFNRIGGVAASNIARYSFATRQWEAVNGGVNDVVRTIAFSPSGVLYIGGLFTDAGGDTNARLIAKDNSGSWVNVNGGISGGAVNKIVFSPSGTLYVGGYFTNAGGNGLADYIAKDGGGGWSSVNGGLSGEVTGIAFSPSGVLYVCGYFNDAGGDSLADYIAKDSSGSWVNVNGGVNNYLNRLAFSPDGTLYIVGGFQEAGGDTLANYIAKDNGGSWANVGGGLNNPCYNAMFDINGDLIASGQFTNAGGDPAADRIALFDGISWKALSNAGGLSGLSASVHSALVDTDTGTVYAGGEFTTAGSIKCACIAAYVKPLADALDMIAGLFEQYQVWSGITNGNSHDHSGGDGAQVNHTTLSNIGTNTHAQIDTHIALKRWSTKVKATDESVNNSSALQNDSDITITLLANGIYAVRGRFWFTTLAAADFKYRFIYAGTLLYIKHTSYPAGSSIGITNIDTASPTPTTTVLGTGTAGGLVEFDALVKCDGSNRNFYLQWAQNTATVGNTTVLAGSYIEACAG